MKAYRVSQPPLYGGTNCTIADGTAKYELCQRDCTGVWSAWSSCANNEEKRTRKFTVTLHRQLDGKQCDYRDGRVQEEKPKTPQTPYQFPLNPLRTGRP